jgi:hypothetical protein
MKCAEQLEAIRQTLTELVQAQMTAALCVSRLQELVASDADVFAPTSGTMPWADETRFCVTCGKRSCHLGRTKCFRLFTRLLRRVNHFVSYDHLLRDVWDGDVKSPDTVRSAVRELKAKLIRARMRRVANAIRGEGRHYGLMLGRGGAT